MIIKLETKLEDAYSESLTEWIEETIISKDQKSIDSIRELWDNEPWEDLQDKISF